MAFRRSSTYITPLIFFLIVISFFPIALSPDQDFLRSLAPGVIWIAALLSSLLAIETIFSEDFRDGTLDEFFISNDPSFVLVFAKVLCHWLVTGFPILLASIISSLIFFQFEICFRLFNIVLLLELSTSGNAFVMHVLKLVNSVIHCALVLRLLNILLHATITSKYNTKYPNIIKQIGARILAIYALSQYVVIEVEPLVQSNMSPKVGAIDIR